jgi:hypothetical protein
MKGQCDAGRRRRRRRWMEGSERGRREEGWNHREVGPYNFRFLRFGTPDACDLDPSSTPMT